MIQIDRIKSNLLEILKFGGVNILENQIEIIDCGCPHLTNILPVGKKAVYMFFYDSVCLKIGKVGKKSNARYNSQHYNPNSSKSNLAKSILLDNNFPVIITNDEIGDWIKNNTQRVNIILDDIFDVFVLNFIEAYLQLMLKPKYEG